MSPSHLLSRYIIHLHFHRHSQPNRPHIAHIEIPEKYSANVQITCAHCHAHYRRHQDPSATLWGSWFSGLRTQDSALLHLWCNPRASFSTNRECKVAAKRPTTSSGQVNWVSGWRIKSIRIAEIRKWIWQSWVYAFCGPGLLTARSIGACSMGLSATHLVQRNALTQNSPLMCNAHNWVGFRLVET